MTTQPGELRRRERSKMKRADCTKALAAFAPRVLRFLESSDCAAFRSGLCEPDEINVQILVRGRYGVADELFEAIRVLAGHRIAADDKRPRRRIAHGR